MSEDDIVSLVELEGTVEGAFFQMSPNSQNIYVGHLESCRDRVADARMTRTVEDYLGATSCLQNLLNNIEPILEAEQKAVEEHPGPDPLPPPQEKPPDEEPAPLPPPAAPAEPALGIPTWGWIAGGLGFAAILVLATKV
jgi:hypothetical protein